MPDQTRTTDALQPHDRVIGFGEVEKVIDAGWAGWRAVHFTNEIEPVYSVADDVWNLEPADA